MKWICSIAVVAIFFAMACSGTAKEETASGITRSHTDSRITQTIRYNQNGQPFLKIRYDYNDNGQLEREVFWDSSYSGVRTREKVYFYEDSLKRRVEMKSDGGGVEYVGTFQYDDQGRVIREEFTDSSLYHWITYEYNDQDQITEQVDWQMPNQYQKLVYTYNDAHMLDTIRSINSSGRITREDIYDYQDDTTQTRLTMYDSTGNTLATWKYEYNDKGQLEEQVEIGSNGNQFVIKKYSYNERGNVVQEESFKYQFYTRRFDYDSLGYLVQERYFDRMGNMNYRTLYEPKP